MSATIWITVEDGLVDTVHCDRRNDVEVVTLQFDTDMDPRCPDHPHQACGTASKWTFSELPGEYEYLGRYCPRCDVFRDFPEDDDDDQTASSDPATS